MSDARYCPTCGYLLGNVRDAIYLIRGSWKCSSCGYYGDGVEKYLPRYSSHYYISEGGDFGRGEEQKFLEKSPPANGGDYS